MKVPKPDGPGCKRGVQRVQFVTASACQVRGAIDGEERRFRSHRGLYRRGHEIDAVIVTEFLDG